MCFLSMPNFLMGNMWSKCNNIRWFDHCWVYYLLKIFWNFNNLQKIPRNSKNTNRLEYIYSLDFFIMFLSGFLNIPRGWENLSWTQELKSWTFWKFQVPYQGIMAWRSLRASDFLRTLLMCVYKRNLLDFESI